MLEEYTAAPQHLGTSGAASAPLALLLLLIASHRRKARQREESYLPSHPGYRALRSPQTQLRALYASLYRSRLEKDPPKSSRSFS